MSDCSLAYINLLERKEPMPKIWLITGIAPGLGLSVAAAALAAGERVDATDTSVTQVPGGRGSDHPSGVEL
jgi:hypothetical protein